MKSADIYGSAPSDFIPLQVWWAAQEFLLGCMLPAGRRLPTPALRDASMKCLLSDLFKMPSFRCRRKTRGPGETCGSKYGLEDWKPNEHIALGLNPGHCCVAPGEELLCHLLPLPQ